MILTRRTLVISLPGYEGAVAEVLGLSHPYGHSWGQATLRLVEAAGWRQVLPA